MVICIGKSATAQDFEGVITAKMTAQGMALDTEYQVKKEQNVMIVKMGGIPVQKMYNDGKGTMYVLQEQNGQKMAMKITLPKPDNKKDDAKIEATKETKEILGYKCTKIIVKTEKASSIFWSTKEVKIDFAKVMGAGKKGNSGEKIKEYGFPLEFESTDEKGATTKMTITKIEPKTVENAVFPNLSEYTIQEMPNMGGK